MKKSTNRRHIIHSRNESDNPKYPDQFFINDGLTIRNSRSETSRNDIGPTESRLNFVKNVLNGDLLQPMVDFNNTSTEKINLRLNKKVIDARLLFNSMNLKLEYLQSGSTGHTFKATSREDPNVSFAIKVCAYPKDDEYGSINNLRRPENAELRMLKLLSKFVVEFSTPHLALPIGSFNTSITHFINVPKNIIDLSREKNGHYRDFIAAYHNGEFEDFVSVLISEWCNGGDLLDYIMKNYKKMTVKIWTVIIFHVLFTLALIHEHFPAFRHNDLKSNNILVEKTEHITNDPNVRYRYNMDNYKFVIPNIDIQMKIWDFDFACIDKIIPNNKVDSDWTKGIGISREKNQYYDMHYFLNTLINPKFFPHCNRGGMPQEIIDFIHRVIPPQYRNGKYVSKKGRMLCNYEYTTPKKVIFRDQLFEKYRFRDVNS